MMTKSGKPDLVRGNPAFAKLHGLRIGQTWVPTSAGTSGCGAPSLIPLEKTQFVLAKMEVITHHQPNGPGSISVRPRRVEGPDGEFAPREGAALVAVHGDEPRDQIRKPEWRGVHSRGRLLRAVGETNECSGDKIKARAPDADKIDLRLRHRPRELADRCIAD
jgi:hypothetical protein